MIVIGVLKFEQIMCAFFLFQSVFLLITINFFLKKKDTVEPYISGNRVTNQQHKVNIHILTENEKKN